MMSDENPIQRACPCCGETSVKDLFVWTYEQENQKHRLGKCLSCNMIFVTNSDEIDMSNKAYVSWVPDSDEDAMTPEKLQINQNILDFAAKYMPSNAQILDYGAGYCGFLRIAKSAGYKVEGINPCIYLADWSRKKLGIDVHAVFGQDFEPGKEYDFIMSDQTFEHLEEPVKDLKKLHNLLKKNGFAYINVPNYWGYRRLIHGIKHLKDVMHYNYFTPKTLSTMCSKNGFRIIKVAPTVQNGFIKILSKAILDKLGIGDCSVLVQKI